MNRDEGVGPFFTKIAHVRDQLITIGITVDDDDLVETIVDGLPNSWETFLASVSGRENQPNFGMIAWKKKEEFQVRQLALRKGIFTYNKDKEVQEALPSAKEGIETTR